MDFSNLLVNTFNNLLMPLKVIDIPKYMFQAFGHIHLHKN